MAVLVCSPLLGRQTCRIPGAGWPANLSRLVNSSSVKEIRLKKSGRASEEDTCCWPLEYTVVVTSESSMCLYTYQHTQAHTRTCTHSPPPMWSVHWCLEDLLLTANPCVWADLLSKCSSHTWPAALWGFRIKDRKDSMSVKPDRSLLREAALLESGPSEHLVFVVDTMFNV